MNIIKTGELYRVCDDGIEVGRTLEAGHFEVVCLPNKGFYLKRVKVPNARNIKVYGKMGERVEKVLRSYSLSPRNLGVILSGAKGIGKSLFAKLISASAAEDGLPVIMVNRFYDGLPQFLVSIEQRCVVLFDEFDKNFFDASRDTEDHTAVQDAFLTLFDGVYASNKLFIITANSLDRLSEFLVNRPGRFRYHIRFSYPDETEIRQFLADKLRDGRGSGEIESVVKFSTIVPLSYDCLTAIATELAMGESFESCLEILNIINVTGEHHYGGILRFEGGGEGRAGWVGSHNFFDKNRDSSIIQMEICAFTGTKIVEVGNLLMRHGDVRRFGHFLQDGSIVIPYDGGRNFRWKAKRVSGKGTAAFTSPTELVLTSNDGSQPVSFKELI